MEHIIVSEIVAEIYTSTRFKDSSRFSEKNYEIITTTLEHLKKYNTINREKLLDKLTKIRIKFTKVK